MNNREQNAAAISTLIGALTKSESGKLVSVLTRVFGGHNLAMAEDMAQDVFLKAMETWPVSGVPDNPSAWLFTAARNKAIDAIRKYRRQKTFATDISELLSSEYTVAATLNDRFNKDEIDDDQLRMMFACCHPAIAREGQIALIMKTLCGFSVARIAKAFITAPDTVEKRLYRARAAFREHNDALRIPSGNELVERLDIVLETIYLLFNEAYSTSYQRSLVSGGLAADAIHLCGLLTANDATRLPKVNALLALLYFHTSRMNGRVDARGDLVLLKDQPRELWDRDMMERGSRHLAMAATGDEISRYHLEAAIGYEHCKAATYAATDWDAILSFYDVLAKLVPSPVVLLNRAVAVKESRGAAEALACIRAIPGIDYLDKYYLLHAILGELYAELNDAIRAVAHYQKALDLSVSGTERRFIAARLGRLSP